MAWQGARLRPSRYSASGGSRRPQRKIEHRSLPPASIAASDSVRTERKGERRPLAPRRSGMSPNASHRVRPGLSSAASLITTLLISFDQEVLNQHLNLVTPEYPFFESPCRTPTSGCHEHFGDGTLEIFGTLSFTASTAHEAEEAFSLRGDNIEACGKTVTAQLDFKAPLGTKIKQVNTWWIDTKLVNVQTTEITKMNSDSATAVGSIHGM